MQTRHFAYFWHEARRVSKLWGYKYFTAENRIAIVGPQGEKIRLVIERP